MKTVKTVKSEKSVKTVKSIKPRKTIHFLVSTLAIVMMFVSCGQNEEVEVIENYDINGKTEVRFTSGITQQAVLDNAGTRMAYSNWVDGDSVGIFMVSHDNSNSVIVLGENKKYTTNAEGLFSPVSGNELYYPVNGTKVDFVAYYPYKKNVKYNGLIDVCIDTVQNNANQPKFDLLYATNREGHSNVSESVALQFSHKFSKIVINIVQPSDLNPNTTGIVDRELSYMKISIIGMYTSTSIDLRTGSIFSHSDKANIIPRTFYRGKKYDAIVLPGTYNGENKLKVTFTLENNETNNNETFTWTLPDVTFRSGNQYNYTVTISRRNGVEVEWKITNWVDNVDPSAFYAE